MATTLFNRIGSWQAKIGIIIYAVAYVFFGFLWLPRIFKVKCNICGWRGRAFHDLDCGGGRINKNVVCPSCSAQPRHRIFFAYLQKVIPKNKKLKVLHFAPEVSIAKLFQSYPLVDYLSVDIDESKAMQKENITALSFPDNNFDIIFCSHVLEHIEDDKKAMQELLRVLKPGGFAIIDVPIDYTNEKTYEDASITSPEERTVAFWQYDHVRLYGKDFPEKLRAAGFTVQEDYFAKTIPQKEKDYFEFPEHPIYFCTKS